MTAGKFITIEGTEGAGKTTVMNFIRDYLAKDKIDVIFTREPGGTDVAEELRNLILHPVHAEVIEPETELLMVFAARAQHLKKKILPALKAGKWVISDRFIDASYAYQGGGRQIDAKSIRLFDEWVVGSAYPDLTLLLDISPEQGFTRAESRGKDKDRIEKEKLDFFIRVREAYLQRAKQDPDRIKIIDASKSLSEVEDQIHQILDIFMKREKT